MFLIEIDFCSVMVIQGLVLNFSLCLLIFLNGASLSSILFKDSKKVLEWWIDFIVLKFTGVRPVYWEETLNEFFMIECWPITFNYIGFFVWSIWQNMGRNENEVRDVTWLLLNCLILFLEIYNCKKYYQLESFSKK